MFTLEPRTLYLAGATFVAIGAVHLLVLAYRLPVEHRSSARAWSLGCFSAAVSWVFFALDSMLPDIATILFGNLTYLAAAVLLYQSVRLFDALKVGPRLYYTLVIPAIALTLANKYIIDSFATRVTVMSLAVAVPLALAAWHLLSSARDAAPRAGRWMTATWLGVSATVLVIRAVGASLGANFETLGDSPAQGIVLAAALLSVTALVFSYYLLYFDRSTSDLRFQAERDPLTGLLNRRAFQSIATRTVEHAKAQGKPLAVLLIDANDFKLINDERGHDAGDETLRHIADTLLRNLRQEDISARLGGDEFAILLPGLQEVQAHLLADRLSARVSDAAAGGGGVSISIGVSSLKPGHEDIATLLRDADLLLYGEKRKRNTTLFPRTTPVR